MTCDSCDLYRHQVDLLSRSLAAQAEAAAVTSARLWRAESELGRRYGMRRELETLLDVGDTMDPEHFERGLARVKALLVAEAELGRRVAAERAHAEMVLGLADLQRVEVGG